MFRKLLLVPVLAAALPIGGCGLFTPSDNAEAVVRIPKANASASAFAPAAASAVREWYRVSVTGAGSAPVAVTGEVDGAPVRLGDLEPGAPRYFTAELFSDGALTQKTHAGVSAGVTLVAGETAQITVDVRSLATNRPPSLASAVIADGAYTTDSVITCEPQGFADADGDAPQYRFAWLVNGAAVGVAAESIAGDSFSKGDTVHCRATPFDGLAEGAAVESNEVGIVNSAPTVGVSFVNGPYFVSTSITPSVSPADADGDAVSLTYAWAIGTETQMVTAPTFPAGSAIRGQTVSVTVTASDGAATSAAVSAGVVIQNSPPNLASVALSNTAPTTNGVISATPGNTSDADGDQVSTSYQWYKNGLPIVGQTQSSLNGNYFDRGDVVHVLVWPNDGFDDGLAVSSLSAVVANTPPSMSSVGFTPTPVYESSTLLPNPVGFFDVDGDAPAYLYTWYVDGISVSTAFSINGGSFDKGQTLWVEVKPYDGYDYGAPVSSSTAVVQNSKPYISWVYFQQTLYTETTAEIGLTLGDDDLGDTLSYEYQWSVDAGAVTGWQAMHTLNGSNFDKNQTVTVAVRIYDGAEYSDVVSESTVVQNTPPVPGTYTLTPTQAKSGMTPFVLQADMPAIDADGDSLIYMVDWYKNGVYLSSNSSLGFTVATLPGEQWYAQVAVFDGQVWSNSVQTGNTVVVAKTATQVSVGNRMACAVTENNDLECWGDGYLGRGSYETQSTPVKITAFAGDVSSVSVGNLDVCAAKTDNTLWCWGYNTYGETGHGFSGSAVPVPTQVPAFAAKQVTVGLGHTCAINTADELYCWGLGSSGELGLGNNNSLTGPAVSTLTSVKHVSAGYQRTCAVNLSGSVYCWGSDPLPAQGSSQNLPAIVSLGVTATTVTAGRSHACALTAAPDVRCWGENAKGQLGDGTTTRSGSPVTVNLESAVPGDVAAGDEFTCAVTDLGASCWGDNKAGSLGTGVRSKSLSPAVVALASTVGMPVQIDAGNVGAVCATYDDGALYCWGFNDGGVLGRGVGQLLFTPVANNMDVEGLAANGSSICSIFAGDTWCWGANNWGQFGTGGVDNYVWEPTMASGGTAPAASAALGQGHLCTLRTDQSVWCSGRNFDGEVGDGTSGNYVFYAAKVPGLTATAVSLGDLHSCAVRTDGKVACWGKNDQGQLGIGTAGGFVTAPAEVSGVTNAVAVSAGRDHTCAVTSAGALYCWGDNTNGAVGDATTTDQPAPVQIFSSGVQLVEASLAFTCAIMTDTTVWCWGLNNGGSLGNGTTFTSSSTPQAVVNGFTAKALSSAGSSICAIDMADDVYCWGLNVDATIGLDIGAYVPAPAGPVVQNVSMIASGGRSVCAFAPATPPNGTLYCWGNNDTGQLLDPATLVPETVFEYWPSTYGL